MKVEVLPGLYEKQNLERRAHLTLINDWSGSMYEFKPAHDAALKQMLSDMAGVSILRQGLELALCDFSCDVQFQDFAPISFYEKSQKPFHGGFSTALGEAIDTTIDQTIKRRQMLEDDGIQVVRSVCVVLSDGKASDINKLQAVMPKIDSAIRTEAIEFIPVILEGMHSGPLKAIFQVDPIPVEAVNFSLMFAGLMRSMSQCSQAGPDSSISAYEVMLIEYQKQLAITHQEGKGA